MEKNSEKRWRSKVSEGLRVKIPKDIADIYKVKKDNIVEWIYDGGENIKIEIKEIVLREKKAKVEKVEDREAKVGEVEDKEIKVERVGNRDKKKVKVKKVENREVKVEKVGDRDN